MNASSTEWPAYQPGSLLDAIALRLNANSDAALAKLLGIQAPLLSKVRNGSLPVSGGLLLCIHEVTGLSIVELRALMGDRRRFFRIGARHIARQRVLDGGAPTHRRRQAPASTHGLRATGTGE